MASMNIFASIITGVAGVGWYSYLYYYFYKVFFINVSLEPVIGPCRENFEMSVCRGATWVFLWLMDLPVTVMLFLVFSLLLALAVKLLPKLTIFTRYVLFGYVSSYLAVVGFTYPEEFNLVSWYTLSAVTTHSIIITGSLWAANHLTRRYNQGSMKWKER